MKTLAAFFNSALIVTVLYGVPVMADGEHKNGHHHSGNAIGEPGDKTKINRVIHVDMTDAMRFIPAQISVKQGETIRFVIKNSGKVKHEFVLGTEADLKEHYQVMLKYPNMEHADDNMISVTPGQTGDVIWRFSASGTVNFACLQPGHYDAGMKGLIAVAGKSITPAPHAHDAHDDHKH